MADDLMLDGTQRRKMKQAAEKVLADSLGVPVESIRSMTKEGVRGHVLVDTRPVVMKPQVVAEPGAALQPPQWRSGQKKQQVPEVPQEVSSIAVICLNRNGLLAYGEFHGSLMDSE